MSDSVALLLLFVVLPVVLAVAVAALVQWRAKPVPASHRTSALLREGTPAEATLMEWNMTGQSFLERRPMVTFRVEVRQDTPFQLAITQSVHRELLRRLTPGMTVSVRLAPDNQAGAIAFPAE